MSESKLIKFLQKPLVNAKGKLQRIPVILADSKGFYVRDQVNNQIDRNIRFWCKGGSRIQDSYNWLKRNINSKIQYTGDIHLYVWLGTCNLTSKNKNGKLALTMQNDDTIEFITAYFHKFIELMKRYPNSRLTFLETPVYSIKTYNKPKPDDKARTEQLKELDKELQLQVYKLNGKIRELNISLNTASPNFSIHTKASAKKFGKSIQYYNYNLYTDGVHPKQNLARVWLREISNYMRVDCWQ